MCVLLLRLYYLLCPIVVQGRSAGDGGGGQGGGREQQREETTTNHGDVEFFRYVREDSRRRVDCGGECGVRSGRVLGSYSRERDARRPGGDLEDGLGRREPGISPRSDRFRILIGSVGASHWYCRRRAPVKPTGHSRRRETVRSRPRAKRLGTTADPKSIASRLQNTVYTAVTELPGTRWARKTPKTEVRIGPGWFYRRVKIRLTRKFSSNFAELFKISSE